MTGPLTLGEIAALAKERLSPPVWDFINGGAGEERTLAANQAAFERTWLRPRMLTAGGAPDISTRVLGGDWAAPIGVAPLAYHTMAHPDGEVGTARAAGRRGLPVVVSTFAGKPFQDIAAAATAPLWLQVYCFRDRAVTRAVVENAERAGFSAVVLTVDTPHLGRRLRDVRNEFRLPPGVTPANLPPADHSSPMTHGRAELAADLDWSVVGWLRSITSLPVLVKGVLTGEDAARAMDAGAAGVIVSNHGGRQLDGWPPTLRVLPEVVDSVGGRCPVLLDSGVRRGADVLAALALGADAVLVGRPVLHGLALDGEAGVGRVLDILTEELTDAMTLTGTGSLKAAGPELISTEPVPVVGRLRRERLHASLSDQLLDTMNFLNEITLRYPEAISFAAGRPYGGFFDTEQVLAAIRRYLDHLAAGGMTPEQVRDALYQYGPTAGQIRELVAETLRRDEGIDVTAASIVVTVGGQEAMLLALRALHAGPDDVLLVCTPCYVGITGAARLLDVTVRCVEERLDGLAAADVEAAVVEERRRGRRPRAVYLVPDHSNPSGTTIGLAERARLLAVAARHDLLILEDSPYRLVSPGEQLPTLKALDVNRSVIHIGSFAKTVFPGARLGYVVADQRVVGDTGHEGLLADELAKIKSMVTVNTSSLSQAAVAGVLLDADLRVTEHVAGPAAHYGASMRYALDRLAELLPVQRRTSLGVSWNEPTGGFFLTMRVGFVADDDALTRSAREFGVVWTPMSYFHPDGGGRQSIRLSISYLTLPEIAAGLDRLVDFIEAQTAGGQPATIR